MITLDTSQSSIITHFLARTQNPDMFPAMDEIGLRFIRRVRLGFRSSTDPFGSQWEPLKVRTGQPLLDTGRLQKSFSHFATNDYVRIGSNLVYAATHNEGRDKIPKRQIIPGDEIPKDWENEALMVIEQHIQELADRAVS